MYRPRAPCNAVHTAADADGQGNREEATRGIDTRYLKNSLQEGRSEWNRDPANWLQCGGNPFMYHFANDLIGRFMI